MNTRPPGISVVIPAFEHARYIREAIDSVVRQTLAPRQIIVVDDGSTDATEQIVHELGVAQFFRIDHAGAAAARNFGMAHVDQEYCAFLDADDFWSPNKLEAQMEQMLHQPELDMVFGHVDEFFSPELAPGERHANVRTNVPGYLPGTILAKTEAFKRIGQLNEQLRVGEFIDWYARAQELGVKTAMLDQVVLHRRIHLANSFRKEKSSQGDDFTKILKDMLDRRRAGASKNAVDP